MAQKVSGKVRAVLVGCGGMSRAWLGPAKDIRNLEIVGLVDINRAAAESRAAEYSLGGGVVFDSLKQAIKTTDANAVFDVTIPAAHTGVTLEALKLGCHVLGEKPMSESLADAKKMVKAAAKADRIYAVIQNRRYEPNIRALRSFLAKGRIGDVEELHCDFFIGAHFGGFREEMKYPLLVDMAIHTFDQARYFSQSDPVSVYCHSFNPPRSWYGHDASAVAIFEMTGPTGKPVVYTYRGSWCAEGVNSSWECAWRVYGSKGGLTWHGSEFKAQVPQGKRAGLVHAYQDVPVPVKPLKHLGHNGLIREFVDCCRTGKTPLTTCTDNIKSFAMVMAALKSAEAGKKVKVEW